MRLYFIRIILHFIYIIFYIIYIHYIYFIYKVLTLIIKSDCEVNREGWGSWDSVFSELLSLSLSLSLYIYIYIYVYLYIITNSELFSLESRAYWETRKAFCGFIWLGRRRLEPGVWEGRLNRKRKRQRCFFPSVAHRKGRLKANHNLCTYRKLVQLKCQQPEKSLTLAWHKSQRPRNPCPSLGKGVCTQIQDAEWRVVVGHWQQDDD